MERNSAAGPPDKIARMGGDDKPGFFICHDAAPFLSDR
jgi:hypothetical protein